MPTGDTGKLSLDSPPPQSSSFLASFPSPIHTYPHGPRSFQPEMCAARLVFLATPSLADAIRPTTAVGRTESLVATDESGYGL